MGIRKELHPAYCTLHPFSFLLSYVRLKSQIENMAILNYSTTETSALPGKFLAVMVSGKHDDSEDFEAQCLWEDLLGVPTSLKVSKQRSSELKTEPRSEVPPI